jgi:hypothetical protein
MALKTKRIDVWVAEVADRPGELAHVLGKLAAAGANLRMVIARRQFEATESGIIFVSPITGKKTQQAARDIGFAPTMSVFGLMVEGNDKRGMGADIAARIAKAGINLRAFNATTIGSKFIVYLAFDDAQDQKLAEKALKAKK